MVKRATIHVSSRTKKNHPKTLRNQGNKKKTTNTTYTIFYNQVTFCRKSSCNMVLAKLFHFMALFLAMA